MKTRYSLLIMAIVLLSGMVLSAEKKSEKAEEKSAIKVISSADELNSIIESAGDRLLLFDLYADWCMPCKILSPMLEKIAEKNKEKASVYKINVDKNPKIASAFSVSGIPYVVFVKNKTAVYALTGVQTKKTYQKAIEVLSDMDIEPQKDAGVETEAGNELVKR
ncbi:MAG: redoxin domain-containing protein [Chitinivibrionales bacterium]|nr:redoxin domain-containing protein [Chitinivibrionales bacterium]